MPLIEIPLTLTQDFGPLDVVAALTADRRALTLGVVNPTAAGVSLRLAVEGARVTAPCTRWQITGAAPGAHNSPGRPRVVDIQCREDIETAGALEVAALGCAVFRVPLGR